MTSQTESMALHNQDLYARDQSQTEQKKPTDVNDVNCKYPTGTCLSFCTLHWVFVSEAGRVQGRGKAKVAYTVVTAVTRDVTLTRWLFSCVLEGLVVDQK